jgi:hypothetical protein
VVICCWALWLLAFSWSAGNARMQWRLLTPSCLIYGYGFSYVAVEISVAWAV